MCNCAKKKLQQGLKIFPWVFMSYFWAVFDSFKECFTQTLDIVFSLTLQLRLEGQSLLVTALFPACYQDQAVLSSPLSQTMLLARRKLHLCPTGTLLSSATAVVQVEGVCERKEEKQQTVSSALGWAVPASESSLNILPNTSGQGEEWELISRELQSNNNSEKWIVNSF